MTFRLLLSSLALIALTSATARAYDLFDPAPATELRALSADRPSTTITPRTVDPGHIQIETSLVSLASRPTDEGSESRITYAATHLRIGLLESLELSALIEPIVVTTIDREGDAATSAGYGNTSLRGKINLFGNDGPIAVGLTLFADHTNASGTWDAGIGIPIAATLPLGFELRLNAEGSSRAHNNTDPRDRCVRLSGMVRRELLSPVAILFEVDREIALGDPAFSTLRVGSSLAALLDPSIELDLGARAGLDGPVPDVFVFFGLTGRT